MSVRVRFAPSPTGYLHMGGARTALFNYLFARNQGGTFVLRIEDTDLERSKPEYTDVIIDAMAWLGMTADEGPFFQSLRTEIYVEKANELLEKGLAYKCFCTPEELEADREKALREGLKQMYSRVWRERTDHPEDQPYVVRIKAPLEGSLVIEDMVQGTVRVAAEELDDFIILRSDGNPTYNFVVVVDDATMNISHVIRGADHLNNTFRQIPVYKALGYDIPTFGHLPLVEGLSKRKGSMSVQAYRELGYLPEAVINYISRLGWSHGDQEIFSMDELIEYFGFDHVGRSSGAFDDDKFEWVNGEWMKRLDNNDLAERWLPYLASAGYTVPTADDRIVGIVSVMKERARTLVQMTQASHYFFTNDVTIDQAAAEKWLIPALVPVFEDIIKDLSALDEASWNDEAIKAVYTELCTKHDVKLGKLAQPTRVSVTGNTTSPGLFETLHFIGRENTLSRLQKGLDYMKQAE